MKKKILFIINPIAGNGNKNRIKELILKNLDKLKYEADLRFTEYPKHAIQISEEVAQTGSYNIVVACGGDGTVNEVARGIINTNIIMGVIPVGSGNGLARYLHISRHPEKAIKTINLFNAKTIDTVKICNRKYVNIAGVGFDALISYKFSKNGKRGLWSYIKLIISEFWKYKPRTYLLTTDDKSISRKAFLISYANSSQFGYNAHISPQAKISDGLINISILQPFPKVISPILALRLFTKSIHKSKYCETLSGRQIIVKSDKQEIFAHIDGEPVVFNNEININVVPVSLKIIAGETFKI